jgi:putative phage-type endonuclease
MSTTELTSEMLDRAVTKNRTEEKPFDRAAWLSDRRNAIGASDVAAILGVSPWQSAWDVWADKTGRLSDWQGNTATRLGQHFERAVLDVAEEKLGELRRNIRIVHETLPIAATLDAQCVQTMRPVEAKTTGLAGPVYGDWGTEGTDEVPSNYLVQVHAQLLCTKADLAYLFALLPGRGVVQYEIQRSDKLCDQLANILNDWWQKHVVKDVEPSRDKATLEIVKRLKREPKKTVELGPTEWALSQNLAAKKEAIKELTEQKEAIESQLLAALSDAEQATFPDGSGFSYFAQTRAAYQVQEATFRVMRMRKGKK